MDNTCLHGRTNCKACAILERQSLESARVKSRRRDQKRILNEMLAGLKVTMTEKLARVPEEWNGLELRQLLADTVRDKYAIPLSRARAREYKNTVIVNNL